MLRACCSADVWGWPSCASAGLPEQLCLSRHICSKPILLADTQDTVQRLEAQLAEQDDRVARLEARLDAACGTAAAVEARVATLEAEVVALASQAEDSGAELHAAQQVRPSRVLNVVPLPTRSRICHRKLPAVVSLSLRGRYAFMCVL